MISLQVEEMHVVTFEVWSNLSTSVSIFIFNRSSLQYLVQQQKKVGQTDAQECDQECRNQ